MERVVVTGGAGFVGSHLVRALLEAGYEVHVIDNYSGGKFPDRLSNAATYHEGDIRDSELLKKVFQDTRYVFHTAALPRVQFSIEFPEETTSVNIGGTVCVLNSAHLAGVQRVIYSASSSAYGDQDTLPLVETMTPSPKSPYALQKYVGELECKLFSELHSLQTVSLRYFNVYGPHADPNGPYALVVAKFIELKKQGKPMTIAGTGEHTRDYTHVSDIVSANIRAATSGGVGAGEVFNIGGGRQVSVKEIAQMIGGEVEYVESRHEPAHTLADTTAAQTQLGWKPVVPFEQGLTDLLKEAELV